MITHSIKINMTIYKRLNVLSGEIYLCANRNDTDIGCEFITWCLEENIPFFNKYQVGVTSQIVALNSRINRNTNNNNPTPVDYIHTDALSLDQVIIATLKFDLDVFMYQYDIIDYNEKCKYINV